MANSELKNLMNDAKEWKGMTEEEKRSLILALRELLIRLGLLQNSAEHYLNKLQRNLENSENQADLDVSIKDFMGDTGKAIFSSKVDELLHPDKYARAVLAQQTQQLNDLMEHTEEFLISMNEETAKLISQKAADAAAMMDVLSEQKKDLTGREFLVLADKMQKALDAINEERAYGEHIVKVAVDTINNDKAGGWSVLDIPGAEGFAVMAAMNHLNGSDKVSVMFHTPDGKWFSAKSLDEFNEHIRNYFPNAKGFPVKESDLVEIQRFNDEVEFQDIGGAFEEVRNKMLQHQNDVMFEKVKLLTEQGKLEDRVESVSNALDKTTAKANIYKALSQFSGVKTRDIAASVAFVLADGTKTHKLNENDEVVGFEVERKESKFHKETLGKVAVEFDKDGLTSKVRYYEDKNNEEAITLFAQNGKDIGLGFSGITTEQTRKEVELLIETLPVEVRETLKSFIDEVKRQVELDTALGKDIECINDENENLGKVLSHMEQQDGLTYTQIGSKVDIAGAELGDAKVVLSYVQGQQGNSVPCMYVQTPELTALEDRIVSEGKTNEKLQKEYQKMLGELTVANKADGKEWLMDKDVTEGVLEKALGVTAATAVLDSVYKLQEDFTKGEDNWRTEHQKELSDKVEKVVEVEAKLVEEETMSLS